jgi:hypothetical protein
MLILERNGTLMCEQHNRVSLLRLLARLAQRTLRWL